MNNEEKILSMLESLVQGQTETNKRLNNLEHEVKELKIDVKIVKDDVKYLKRANDEAFKDISMLDDRTVSLLK